MISTRTRARFALPSIVATVVLLRASPPVLAQPATGIPTPEDDVERIRAEIARLDSIWLNAYVTGDAEAVRPVLADDFLGQVYVTLMDKETILARVASSTGLLSTRLERFEVRVFGDVAAAHAIRVDTWSEGDGRRDERYAYTDVYRFREGRWECITGQSAPVTGG